MSAARYLLIGAGGLVGSHLLRALRARDLVATYRRGAPAGARALDITDRAAVIDAVRATRPSAVLLAAAEPHVERCEKEPQPTRRVNVEGTAHVAEAAYSTGATLVVFSSEYVFDGTRGMYREDDTVAPLNEYGRQKVELEQIARSGPHLICRTSGVFGADGARKNFVAQLVDALRAGRRFVVPSDQIITPTDARSLASAVVELLDREETGTFHVAGPEALLRPAFATRVVEAFGLDASLVDARMTASLGLSAPRPLQAGLSDAKLRATLGRGLTPMAEALSALAEEHV